MAERLDVLHRRACSRVDYRRRVAGPGAIRRGHDLYAARLRWRNRSRAAASSRLNLVGLTNVENAIEATDGEDFANGRPQVDQRETTASRLDAPVEGDELT